MYAQNMDTYVFYIDTYREKCCILTDINAHYSVIVFYIWVTHLLIIFIINVIVLLQK